MTHKAGLLVAVLIGVFVLLSVALVDGIGINTEGIFGRTILPITVTITPIPQQCHDTLWGKIIYRKCE